MIEETLGTRDETLAAAKASRKAGEYHLMFLALEGDQRAQKELEIGDGAAVRAEYSRAFAEATAGEIVAYADGEDDPVAFGVEMAIDAIVDPAPVEVDRYGQPVPVLTPLQEARVAGLADGLSQHQGRNPRFREQYEPRFKEVADKWLEGWKAAPGRRPSNTGAQYAAAIRLFDEYWGDRPLREVTERDAAEFVELLKQVPAGHGRGKLAKLPLREVIALHGKEGSGLASPSIKRHLLVLKQIWAWAKPLGYCSGDHPFTARLPRHRARPYLGWETGDLQMLFGAPPLRRDIYEAFYIAMFTGLRASEVADLTWGQVREEQGLAYLAIEDAKTEAGWRKVPLHSKLQWLLQKKRGRDGDPVFPTFNPEGGGKRRGDDASRLFGDSWKRRLGITSRRHVFHSARKNVTRIMEENGVAATAWARVIGHEPGFTYGTYNPDALSLRKCAEIIELIDYPEVNMRDPAEVYADAAKLPRKRHSK
jgi:integrase